MAKVTIYGASDDLIEVEGDIREEFDVYDEPAYLHFSDGTVLRADYTEDGVWKIRKCKGGKSLYRFTKADSEDSENYSDRVTLTGDLEWVECWKSVDGPDHEQLVEWFEDNDGWTDEIPEADVLKIYRIIQAAKREAKS